MADGEHSSETLSTNFPVGTVVKGCVKRVQETGIFVELENGAEGFIENTQTAGGESVAPAEILKAGQPIDVQIVRVNSEQGSVRITLRRANRDDCTPSRH